MIICECKSLVKKKIIINDNYIRIHIFYLSFDARFLFFAMTKAIKNDFINI